MNFLTLLIFFIFSQQAIAINCKEYRAQTTGLTNCKGKSVHLTFDDGPNTTTTPKIIQTLKRQNVPATFFISTHQLEKGDLNKKKAILKDMNESGFTIASHGHDHNCHDIRYDWKGNLEQGYTDDQRREQISKSVNLLNKFTDGKFQKQKNHLIRFPYGRGISPSEKEINKMIESGRHIEGNNYAQKLKYYRENSPAMSIASEYNLDHIGWNHDSQDSSSKFSSKNKDEYVSSIVKYMCLSSPKNLMSLFHDTREINSLPSSLDQEKTVMDEIIEKAKCLGVEFKSMDDFLKSDLQTGIHTKSYNSEKKIEGVFDHLSLINSNNNPTCSELEEVAIIGQGMPCTSKYVGALKHCEGTESFCIDGKWVKSKDIFKMVCLENFSAEAAKRLSSKYLNKTCDESAKRVEVETSEVVCYCQEDEGNNDRLKWNCFDIRTGKARKIN
jgi:peptidoglycan/xylan/chitin deacetylase (PgdA/CDA1 family)